MNEDRLGEVFHAKLNNRQLVCSVAHYLLLSHQAIVNSHNSLDIKFVTQAQLLT